MVGRHGELVGSRPDRDRVVAASAVQDLVNGGQEVVVIAPIDADENKSQDIAHENRQQGSKRTHVRVTNQVFPHAITIPLSQEMTLTQWHVPVDDQNCYWFTIFTSFGKPVDKAAMRAQRLQVYELPDYNWLRRRTYTMRY